jgi:hypothetical protein
VQGEDFYSVDEAARILKLTPGEGKLACNRLVSDWFPVFLSVGVARWRTPSRSGARPARSPRAGERVGDSRNYGN